MAFLWQPVTSLAQDTTAMAKAKVRSNKKMRMEEHKMKGETATSYPYAAEYSSRFKIGNQEYSRMILQLWKDWDNNQLDLHNDYFSDTLTFQAPTGEVIHGKDKFTASGRQQRDMFSNVKSSVEAWVPIRSMDKNQDWVAVWGREEDTGKDGKVSTNMIHEIWGFNKDGKIVFYRQYTAAPPKE